MAQTSASLRTAAQAYMTTSVDDNLLFQQALQKMSFEDITSKVKTCFGNKATISFNDYANCVNNFIQQVVASSSVSLYLLTYLLAAYINFGGSTDPVDKY